MEGFGYFKREGKERREKGEGKGVKSYQEGLVVLYIVELHGFCGSVGFVRLADIVRLRAGDGKREEGRKGREGKERP